MNGNGDIERMPPDPEIGEMSGDQIWSGSDWEPQEGWQGAAGQRPPFTGPWPPRPTPGRPPGPPWGPGWGTQPPSWGPGWKGRPPPGFYDWYFYWGYRLRNAWKDLKYLKELVGDITNEEILKLIEQGIIAPGPNSPVTGPGGGGITGPIMGVTDGSDAGPGEVGQFLHGESRVDYGAYPAVTTTTVSPLVVPPGDWDFWVAMMTVDADPTEIGLPTFVLSPVPIGMSNSMRGGSYSISLNQSYDQQFGVWPGLGARGSFSTPTLMPFAVSIDNSENSAIAAGYVNLVLEARRRR